MASSASDSAVVLDLAEEFLARLRQGQRPRIREYTDQHPELAAEIREVFSAMAMMEHIALADESLVSPPESAAAPPALEQLGDFRIIREVGRGGMGVVYEAEQVSLGRHVALKVLLNKALIDPKRNRRFEREAKAAAKLHHTNIVPVFGVGEQDGMPYYVMQFIQGLGINEVLEELKHLQGKAIPAASDQAPASRGDLSAAEVARCLHTGQFDSRGLEEAPAPPAQGASTVAGPLAAGTSAPPLASDDSALTSGTISSSSLSLPGQSGDVKRSRKRSYWQSVATIGLQVAGALDYAHRQGILHRDIKPSNLLLDTRGTVWITDFGLAKADDQQGLTATGDILGTLRYMPPEAFEGKADRGGDVCALGLTLYKLLALRPAYQEKDRHRLIKQVMNADVERLESVNPAIPRDLVTIVHKAIDHEPARRYPTAGEMAADLQRYLDDEPIKARRLSLVERALKWAKRRPAAAALVGVCTVALLGAVAAGIIYNSQLQEHNAALESALTKEQELRAEADTAKNATTGALKDALTARLTTEKTLADMQTAFGLTAGEQGDPSQALLWFAGAFDQARQDPLRQAANRVRFSTWFRLCALPVNGLQHESPMLRGLSAHPKGQFLLAEDVDDRCTLWDLTKDRKVAFPDDLGKVTCAAWSPDGQQLAVGTAAGLVTIYDFPGFKLRQRIEHRGAIKALAFHKDGQRLALASDVARVWDCSTASFITPELPHPMDVKVMSWNSAGDRLATACLDLKARVFKVGSNSDGQPLFAPIPHAMELNERHYLSARPRPPLFINEDKELLTRGSWVDAESGKLIRPFPYVAVAVSPDGRYLATSVGTTRNSSAQLWRTADGTKGGPAMPHPHDVMSLAFAPDGKTLATACANGTVRRWSVPLGRLLEPVIAHQSAVHLCTYVGDLLATAQDGGLVRLWRFAADDARNWQRPFGGQGAVSRVALSSDGRYALATGTSHSNDLRPLSTRIVEAASGKAVGAELIPGGMLVDAALAPNGHDVALLTTGVGAGLHIMDWTTGVRRAGRLPLASARGLAYSPTRPQLVVLCASGKLGRVYFVDSATGKIDREGIYGPVKYGTNDFVCNGLVRFSPDGQYVVAWGLDNGVHIWDAVSGAKLPNPLLHDNKCHDAKFSPDGRRLATGAFDHNARVWDFPSGKSLAAPLHHPDHVLSVRFSADGKLLLTACRDGMVRLWDWQRGTLVCPAFQHKDEAWDADFVAGGPWVMTVGADKTARLWETQTGKAVAPAWRLPGQGWGWCLQVAPDGTFAVASGLTKAVCGIHLGNLSALDPPRSDDLRLVAEIVSSHRLHEGSGVVKLPAEEWLERWQAFRKRYPDGWAGLDGSIKPRSIQDRAQAELLQWEEKVATFAAFVKLQPKVLRHRYDLALTYLAQQKPAAYRDICREVVRDFGQATTAADLNLAAWLGVLLPDTVEHSQEWVRLAQKAVKAQPGNYSNVSTLGATHYRAGQWQDAVTQLNQSIKLAKGGAVATYLFLAMAHHQLGNKKEARQWLDATTYRIDQDADITNPQPPGWDTNVICQLLRREAETLILGRSGVQGQN